MTKKECRFEDWDDTTLPRPICHCLKRDNVECLNVPDDMGQCPDYEPKGVRMTREQLERSMIALSIQQGHYGTVDVKTVCDMIEDRDKVIRQREKDLKEKME